MNFFLGFVLSAAWHYTCRGVGGFLKKTFVSFSWCRQIFVM